MDSDKKSQMRIILIFILKNALSKGEWLGTCPKCEAELEYLENELIKKHESGEKINIKNRSLLKNIRKLVGNSHLKHHSVLKKNL